MPKKVDHKLRREAFLAAAYRTIKKKGISGVTMRAVAREAGFTTGALTHYVDSSDALLAQASEFSAREVRASMQAAERLPNKLEALRQVLYLALPLDEDRRGNWNFFLGFWERSVHNAAVRHITHLRYKEWLRRTARLIRNAQSAGEIPREIDAKQASRACVALIDGIATQVLRSGHAPNATEQRSLVDEWIVAWLKPVRRSANRARRRRPLKTNGRVQRLRSSPVQRPPKVLR